MRTPKEYSNRNYKEAEDTKAIVSQKLKSSGIHQKDIDTKTKKSGQLQRNIQTNVNEIGRYEEILKQMSKRSEDTKRY